MGIITEIGAKLKLGGEEYRLLFTVNAIEKIEEEMGESIDSLSKWLYEINDKDIVVGFKYTNVARVIHILINESLAMVEENTKSEQNYLSIEQVKRRISNVNIAECTSAVARAFNLSFLDDDHNENPEKSSQR